MGDFFAGLFGILVILWWVVKVIALIIFFVSLAGVIGALLNNNDPDSAQLAWTIIGFVGAIIL
jgi:hypothetical protein